MLQKKSEGFTLIELMITVAVIGILAAVAYPSYMDSVRKTRLSQAKEGAMQAASSLERRVSQGVDYDTNLNSIDKPYNGTSLSYDYATYKADGTTASSTDKERKNYVLKVSEATERFKIWVLVSSTGTRCACAGGDCPSTAPTLTAAKGAACPTNTVAF